MKNPEIFKDKEPLITYFLSAKCSDKDTEYDDGTKEDYRKGIPLTYEENTPVLEEKIAEKMGVKIVHDQHYDEESAGYWNGGTNLLHTHPKAAYKTLDHYRELLLHELAHATMFKVKRLVQEGAEEVVAEATAVLVGAYLNNPDALNPRHFQYMKSAPSQGSDKLMFLRSMGLIPPLVMEKACLEAVAEHIIKARDYLINIIKDIS